MITHKKQQKNALKEQEEAIQQQIEREEYLARVEETDKILAFYEEAYHRMRAEIGGRMSIPKQTLQAVYEDNIKRYGTLTCYLCIKPIEFGNDHVEHKMPVSRGGTNEYINLGIACSHCNRTKHTKTVKEYKNWLNGKNLLNKTT